MQNNNNNSYKNYIQKSDEKNISEDTLIARDCKLIVEDSEGTDDGSSGADTPLKGILVRREHYRNWRHSLKWKFDEWCSPWFLICICLLQLFFFYIGNDCIYQRLMLKPEHHDSQLWRYITYTLIHSDISHLSLNICLQCMIGLILECEQGHWRVAFTYAAGGVSGSLATVLLQPQLSLLGASAAIYAMLMSHIPHLIKNFPHLPHRFLRIIALIVLCVSDIGFTFFHFLVNHNLNPRICLEAHIAGAAVGLCLGFLIFKRVGPEGAK